MTDYIIKIDKHLAIDVTYDKKTVPVTRDGNHDCVTLTDDCSIRFIPTDTLKKIIKKPKKYSVLLICKSNLIESKTVIKLPKKGITIANIPKGEQFEIVIQNIAHDAGDLGLPSSSQIIIVR